MLVNQRFFSGTASIQIKFFSTQVAEINLKEFLKLKKTFLSIQKKSSVS
jgi:hypothetical protein